jgi:hypothetical protein
VNSLRIENVKRVVELFQIAGYTITAPGTLVGASGPQTFDILATRGGEGIVLDIESEQAEVGPDIIAAFFAKIMDTRPRRPILVCIPGLNRDAGSLSTMYNLEIVIASEIQDALTKLSELIGA